MKKLQRVTVVAALVGLMAWTAGCHGTKPDEKTDETSKARKGVSDAREAGEKEAGRSAESQKKSKKEAEAERKAKSDDKKDRYESPDEAYSAPIPPDWSVSQEDGWATMTPPEGDLKVQLTRVEADSARKGVDKAWKQVGLDRELAVKQDAEPPTPESLDGLAAVTYEVTDDQRFYQAVGQLHDGTVYVTLIDGALATVQKRASQIKIISSGLEIAATQETSLEGVEDVRFDEDKQEKLAKHIKTAMETFDVPGVSVGIVQDGEVVWKKGFGVRQKGGDTSVDTDTRMMVGSTTKTMTTMLMATAVDAGKFQWDTPAHEILSEFSLKSPELTEKITMRHLVCACTGVPRRDLEILFNFESMDAKSVFEQLSTFETYTEFGEAFQYSNQMVAAGGYITAAAYGAEPGQLGDGYDEAMQKQVFGPIGMDATTVDFQAAGESDKHAYPHGLNLSGDYTRLDLKLERFVLPLAPSGAAWSTTDDMLRYLQTELAEGEAPDGTRVVSKEALAETWSPQIQMTDEKSYGLGWIVSETKDKKTLSHGGNTLGFTSALMFVPEDGLGITVMANAQAANAFAESIKSRMMELAYETDLQAAENVEFARSQLTQNFTDIKDELAEELDEKAAEAYVGTWKHPALGEIEFTLEDGALRADVGEFSTRLRPKKDEPSEASETEYVSVEPPLIGAEMVFKRTDEGKRVVLGKGAEEYTFEPVSAK